MSDNTYASTIFFSLKNLILKNVWRKLWVCKLTYYWKSYHDPNRKFFWWYDQKLWRLEMCIRRKWNWKTLPLVNIIIKKYKEKDELFDPTQFLNEFDSENYFELLAAWKKEVEASSLKDFPYLCFGPHRRRKNFNETKTLYQRMIFL